jgi:tetratricopeptide (TPR) repeat protein
MTRPHLGSKKALDRLLEKADDARNRMDFERCVKTMEQAARLEPGNAILLLNLGHAYGKNFDFAGAERAFERALRVSSRKAEALAGAAERATDIGNTALAEKYYRLAAEQKNVTPEILVALAEKCERLSRLDEAAQWTERALALNPACAGAVLARARLERHAGRLQEAEQMLRSFPTNADRNTRAKAGYELGGILDRQGRYDEAMTAFQEAKALLAPDAAPHMASARQLRTQLKELGDNLNPEILKRWHETGPDLQRLHALALLCGHPRSGTTLLEQVLDSHPDIVSAEETNIFHDHGYPPLQRVAPLEANILAVLEGAQKNGLQQVRGNYFRCMEAFLGAPIGNRLLVDKNPILTLLIPLFVRIFPESKLLVALRDPRDVCLSCFMQPLALTQVSATFLSMKDTVEEYSGLMSMWRTVKPLLKNPYIEVRYEDMVEDLESVSRRVLEFLGVAWDERVLRFHEHAQQKTVRSPTYADVTRPVFKRAVGRWQRYEKYLAPHLDKLEPFVKAFGYQ